MNKFIIVLLVYVFLMSTTQAQNEIPLGRATDSSQMQNYSNQKMNNRTIMNQLDLTKEQRSAIRQIQQNHKEQKESILNNDSLSLDQKKIMLKELRKQNESDINSVLTEEQRMKRKELKEQNKKDKSENSSMEDDDPGFEETAKPTN